MLKFWSARWNGVAQVVQVVQVVHVRGWLRLPPNPFVEGSGSATSSPLKTKIAHDLPKECLFVLVFTVFRYSERRKELKRPYRFCIRHVSIQQQP
jgi:hypothetical protein